jgi:hypothetical protein
LCKEHPNILRRKTKWLLREKELQVAVILPEWERFRKHPFALSMMQNEMLAYSQSYMLLTAFSFENLFKGILYGRNANNRLAKRKGGHGIAEMAKGYNKTCA